VATGTWPRCKPAGRGARREWGTVCVGSAEKPGAAAGLSRPFARSRRRMLVDDDRRARGAACIGRGEAALGVCSHQRCHIRSLSAVPRAVDGNTVCARQAGGPCGHSCRARRNTYRRCRPAIRIFLNHQRSPGGRRRAGRGRTAETPRSSDKREFTPVCLVYWERQDEPLSHALSDVAVPLLCIRLNRLGRGSP
jgi:hypothetical protein